MRRGLWLLGGVLLGCTEHSPSSPRLDASDASTDAAIGDASDADTPAAGAIAIRSIDLGTGSIAVEVAAGGDHTCALLQNGSIKCWGNAYAGRLGSGQGYEFIGDVPEELGDDLPTVDLGTGQTAASIATGYAHSCAVLTGGKLKCWGHSGFAQLGLGDRENRGDEPGEMGDALPEVDLGIGSSVEHVALGGDHSCALLQGGAVKCWGTASNGRLGLGMPVDDRGDEPGEMGDALPVVDLGGASRLLSVGGGHSCALLESDELKCWGNAAFGQLGTGDTYDRGDELAEMGEALHGIDLGAPANAVVAGGSFSCALLVSGDVKCWGSNQAGQLGLGDRDNRGDEPDEMAAALPTLDLRGKKATALALGNNHACALLETGEIGCWGSRDALGLAAENASHESPSSPSNYTVLSFAPAASRVTAGNRHSCAVLEDGSVVCWGPGG